MSLCQRRLIHAVLEPTPLRHRKHTRDGYESSPARASSRRATSADMQIRPLWMLLALSALAPEAQASLAFPQTIRDEWGVSDLGVRGAGCLLCHTTEAGGALTVQRPFGRTVRDEYEVPGANTGALRSALRRMRDGESDSDRDDIADYDELVLGTDVNVPDAISGDGGSGGTGEGGAAPNEEPSPLSTVPPLQTGCSLSRARRFEWTAIAGVFAVLVAVRRARRRRANR